MADPKAASIIAGIGELDAIIRKYHEPRLVSIAVTGGPAESVLLVPEGYKVEGLRPHLDPYRHAPERRAGTAVFSELASFIGHVNRFKDEDSAVFVSRDREKPGALAVLDYHQKTAAGQPRFGKHRSQYTPPLSDEWKAW